MKKLIVSFKIIRTDSTGANADLSVSAIQTGPDAYTMHLNLRGVDRFFTMTTKTLSAALASYESLPFPLVALI